MRTCLSIIFLLLWSVVFPQIRLKLERSTIAFKSEAPLETIQAATHAATGLLDVNARTFAVQIPVTSFEGFNAPLQREHFNENYMVSRTWPNATFSGRIIEAVDLSKPGTYEVRAKGLLNLRGEARERIIPCHVVVHPLGVEVTTNFEIVVEDHGIRIPRVVQQKIAATVAVRVDLQFQNGDAHR